MRTASSHIRPWTPVGSTRGQKGVHPGFDVYVFYQGAFSKRGLAAWMERLSANKGNTAGAGRPVYTHQFKMVDITGPAAVVKLELYRDDALEYTNYSGGHRL